MKWRRPKGDPTSIEYWKELGEERAVAEWEQEHGLAEPSDDDATGRARVAFDPMIGTGGSFVVQGKKQSGQWVTLRSWSLRNWGEAAAKRQAENFKKTVDDCEIV